MLLQIRYGLEASAAWILYILFSVLPVDVSSALGGWIGRTFGPKLNISNNARKNLSNTFPNLNDLEIEQIVSGMWDNLGRTAGEHPHLSEFNPYKENSRVEVIGIEYCDLLANQESGGLFFGGHLANWEIGSLAGTRRGYNVYGVYRRSNNPFFNKLVQRGRNVLGVKLIPKGSEGAKATIRALKNGEKVVMLVDQKMNDGISVPFFGRDAMTAPALAELALKFEIPIIPARVERLKKATFKVTFYPPLEVKISKNKKADTLSIMKQVNSNLEDWIKEKPEQWLWLHNRWPD